MFIPIPMSFRDPKTAQTVNIGFLVVGLIFMFVFNWYLGGGIMVALALFNMFRTQQAFGGNSGRRNVGREHDKDGFV